LIELGLGKRLLEEGFEESGYAGGVHGEQWAVGGTQSKPTPLASHSTVIRFRDSSASCDFITLLCSDFVTRIALPAQ
jgi:hypothetical protein